MTGRGRWRREGRYYVRWGGDAKVEIHGGVAIISLCPNVHLIFFLVDIPNVILAGAAFFALLKKVSLPYIFLSGGILSILLFGLLK